MNTKSGVDFADFTLAVTDPAMPSSVYFPAHEAKNVPRLLASEVWQPFNCQICTEGWNRGVWDC